MDINASGFGGISFIRAVASEAIWPTQESSLFKNSIMANKPVLYNLDMSAPVRTVKIVAANVGVDLELR